MIGSLDTAEALGSSWKPEMRDDSSTESCFISWGGPHFHVDIEIDRADSQKVSWVKPFYLEEERRNELRGPVCVLQLVPKSFVWTMDCLLLQLCLFWQVGAMLSKSGHEMTGPKICVLIFFQEKAAVVVCLGATKPIERKRDWKVVKKNRTGPRKEKFHFNFG